MASFPMVWDVESLKFWIADEKLLSRLPLTVFAICALQLGWQLTKTSSPRNSPINGQNGENSKRSASPAVSESDNVAQCQQFWPWSLMVLEGLFVVACVGAVGYQQYLDSSGKYSADLVFWSFVLILLMLHQWPIRRLESVQSAIRQRRMLLYVIRWLTALAVLLAPASQDNRGILQCMEPRLVILIFTTLLLLIQLFIPSSTLPKSFTFLDPTRESYSSPLGKISFAWVDGLLLKRWKSTRLQFHNVPKLSALDGAALNAQEFQKTRVPKKELLWRLLRHFRQLLLLQALFAFFHGVLSFVPTILLRSILQCMEGDSNATEGKAWHFLICLSVASSLSAIMENHSTWIGQKFGLRLRSVIMNEIYTKALKRQIASTVQVNEGMVTNLLTADAYKIADAGANTFKVWSSVPVQVCLAITLLYSVLGVSAFAGVALMIAIEPLNTRIAQKFGAIQSNILAASDTRINATSRMIRSFRVIKLFAWGPLFEQRIEDKRAVELRALRARYILWSLAATIWYGMPVLITFSSFLVYAMTTKKPLLPSLAFTALSLFNLLKSPLDELVGMLTRAQDSLIWIKRVETFLRETETNKYVQLSQRIPQDSSYVGFKHATFIWGDTKNKANAPNSLSDGFALKHLDLTFKTGRLNLVTGATGSGKSSLLLALLGEMTLVDGIIHMPAAISREKLPASPSSQLDNNVAYCAQEAWLLNDTIRNNILFGSAYMVDRYEAVLSACDLNADFRTLPQGDYTVVGEQGATISGGQKQRIALARAFYSNASLILLDDCLSAMDSYTATWVFEQCLNGSLAKGRTRILVTHNVTLTAAAADYMILLSQGNVLAAGAPSEVIATGLMELDDLSTGRKTAEAGENRVHERVIDAKDHPLVSEDTHERGKDLAQLEETDDLGSLESNPGDIHINNKILLRNVRGYLASMGCLHFWLLLAFFFVAQQAGSIAPNWWIRKLSNAYVQVGTRAFNSRPGEVPSHIATLDDPGEVPGVNASYYFGVCAIIIVVYLIVGLLRLLFVSKGSLNASTSIHRQLLKSVMNSKFRFFDHASFGEIIDRFSHDLQTVDQDLAVLAVATLHFLVALFGIIILIATTTPAFIGPGLLVSMGYYLIGVAYIATSRDLQELEAYQRSPLSQHLGETLSGITTIRAYSASQRFLVENLDRIDRANRPSFVLAATERWLSVRLGLLGAFVCFLAGTFAISNASNPSAGAVGLSMSYALVFSEHVLWLIRYYSANIQNMAALQRVQKLIGLPQEGPSTANATTETEHWPSYGELKYDNVSARHRHGQNRVLQDVSFSIKPGERVGVVGRTGAGKSSLLLTLFRGLEIECGQIVIDGLDTKMVDLEILRRRLAIILQDPILFAETLRFNLDPLKEHTDEEIIDALKKVGLLDHTGGDNSVCTLPKPVQEPLQSQKGSEILPTRRNRFADLSFALTESGSNISQGQRQLVCIARALLKKSKIMVLDEATSSIDYETDLKIQNLIRNLACTVVTVAHRLRTVINYNQIIVLENGQVKECDYPWRLLQQGGLFRDMCEAATDKENLLSLAEAAWQATNREKEE